MARPALSIRTKLILSISIPLLITYLSLLLWDYFHQRDLAVKELQDTVQQRVEGIAGQLDARLTQIAQLSQLVARPLESRHTDPLIRVAATTALRNPWVVGVMVVFNDGNGPVAKTVGPEGENPRYLNLVLGTTPAASPVPEWYDRTQQQAATGWTGGRWVQSTRGKRRVATYYAPIRSGEQTVGAVGLDVALDTLRRFNGPRGGNGPPRNGVVGGGGGGVDGGSVAASRPIETQRARIDNGPPPDGGRAGDDFVLFDGQGELLNAPAIDVNDAEPHSLFDDARILNEPALADAAKAALGGESQVLVIDNLKTVMPSVDSDTRHWLALTPIRSTGWLLAMALPESGRMKEVVDRLWQRVLFLSVGSLVMLGIVWVVAVRISRPIEALARGVDAVAAGDLTATVPAGRSRDELGRLARGFNHMTARIRHHVDEIRSTTAAHERVESELRVARQIQLDLLPKTFPPFPDRREFDLHALNLSALHVAGDFYDFFFGPGGKLTLVIADVSGKGVPAALLMAVTRTLVRNLALSGQSPAQIMTATNRALIADTPQSMFVTMVLAQYDPATGTLTYVNAGHPPALRLRAGQGATTQGATTMCDDNSSILGVDDSGALGEFIQHEEQLAPGDTLLLYTDGVSESPTPAGPLLGTDGLIELLRHHSADAPAALCETLAETLRGYQRDGLVDDLTMLALRRVT